MTMTDVKQEYFSWLCDLVDADKGDKPYLILLRELHKTEFYAVIDRDNNRLQDGKNLREEFLYDTDDCGMLYMDAIEMLDGPCSMLEFLIGLSQRMAYELYSAAYGYNLSRCFWELIENCGLGQCSDEDYAEPYFDPGYIGQVCDRICTRSFGKYGEHGLFPLWPPVTRYGLKSAMSVDSACEIEEKLERLFGRKVPDQRKIEFYVQMEYYSTLNYPAVADADVWVDPLPGE